MSMITKCFIEQRDRNPQWTTEQRDVGDDENIYLPLIGMNAWPQFSVVNLCNYS